MEDALGSKSRSGGQLAGWDSVYGPVGDDGYPKPLWDHVTGKIDKEVVQYMKDHGYDLARCTSPSIEWKPFTQRTCRIHLRPASGPHVVSDKLLGTRALDGGHDERCTGSLTLRMEPGRPAGFVWQTAPQHLSRRLGYRY
jgi:hypothetical protein